MQTFSFYVQGTHCSACKILIEDVLQDTFPEGRIRVRLETKIVEISDVASSEKEVLQRCNELLTPHGYTLSIEIMQPKKNEDLWIALPLGLSLLILFFLLQKSGVLQIATGGDMTFWGAFMVGIIASLSTCLAVIGGLVLSLSSKIAASDAGFRPILFFHIGRLGGFFLLGSLLGIASTMITVHGTITSILGIAVSVLMIGVGMGLLGIHLLRRTSTFSEKIFQKMTKNSLGVGAPLIIGIGTFFLPCGFTQSMQVVALSSGSWMSGGMTMFAFALGTLPVLSLISFGSLSLAHTPYAKIFLKTAGIVVIGLGVFTLLTGLTGLGILPPLFSLS